ncbi:MAG: GntR family transcriptional regulator [Betaproteobacteria bacterium]|nr:GntR family transcriptional regulator [Betaproteobacteria bacterium]
MAATTLRDQAYQRFTRGLLSREIRAGQFVSQRELTAITGMSLGAIREMIPRLEADGLIRTVPQRGLQVAQVDVNLIRNAFQFRLILEREAAAAFARSAPTAEFDRLQEAHEAVLALAARAVTPALIARAQAVDDGMHATIVDALGNDIISNQHRVNSIKIRLIRQDQTRIDAARVAPVMEAHLAVIAALRTRDPVRAAEAMAAHIEGARQRALGLEPQQAPPGA